MTNIKIKELPRWTNIKIEELSVWKGQQLKHKLITSMVMKTIQT